MGGFELMQEYRWDSRVYPEHAGQLKPARTFRLRRRAAPGEMTTASFRQFSHFSVSSVVSPTLFS
jgi:hypothetical protein